MSFDGSFRIHRRRRTGEDEDGIAVGAEKPYDVEMDCAAVMHGKLDARVELSGGCTKREVSKVSEGSFSFLE